MKEKLKDEFILRTTINVESELLELLKEKCKELDVSLTSVIKKAVKMYIDNMEKDDYKWHTLTYQKKGLSYKKFHIKLKAFEYDTYSDAKKITRLSFSHIVAIALRNFSEIIFSGDYEDTYPLYGYSKYYFTEDNCTYLVFSWRISRKEVNITLPPLE
jgi:hypothetical protein